MNKVAYIITTDAISITIDGVTTTVPKHALNYQAVKKAIIEGDINTLKEAMNSEGFIGAITEGKVTYENGVLKFSGHDIAPSIAKKLTTILNEGIPALPWLKFVDRLIANPSKRCLDNLYEFLDHKGMPISETGTCLGYKGVSEDYYSLHGNKDTIVLQGKVNDNHQIYNGIGEIIEVARLSVDDDPNNGCSAGLHIGSFDYADSWAGSDGRLMLVEFDPKNAVSVPSDCQYQKLRVTKYEVINEITDNRKLLDRPVYSIEDDENEDGSTLHPVSQPEIDDAIAKLEDWHEALQMPIPLRKLANDHDISIFDLVNQLVKRGWDIDWDDIDDPKASKNTLG
tara:strand:- start:513 stop:1532 length:1020 start_codon:yes stop_codon:yes gene_type:complete